MDPNTAAGAPRANPSLPAARSCLTCAKAKARCEKKTGSDVCERCTRLRKDCHTKDPVVRKRKPVKLTRTAQLENLENKLENLVHALSAQQQAAQHQQYGGDDGQPSPPNSRTTSERGREATAMEEINAAMSACEHEVSCSTNVGQPRQQHDRIGATLPLVHEISSTESTTISLNEAEVLLDRYKRLMAEGMPFLVIPEEKMAWHVAEETPFLMQAIATVTMFHNLPRQQAMAKQLMRQISEKLLINGERSLEVLQGMLVFLNWYHPHLFWGQQSTNLLHLATALTTDLGIDRPPGSCEKSKLGMVGVVKAVHQGASNMPKIVANDERRALLGTYYLATMLATCFKKLDSPRWTPWMQECLSALEQGAEYESDAILVQMVRTQRIMDEALTIDQPEAPSRLYARSLQADLERLDMPTTAEKTHMGSFLKQQRAVARLAIWEHSFADLGDVPDASSNLRPRLEGMWACVEAIRDYMDLHFAIPVGVYLTESFAVYGHFAFAFMNLLRLSALDIDGWDAKYFRDQLEFSALMGEASQRFEDVEKTMPDGLVVKNDSFTKWAQKTRWMKHFYESKFMPQKLHQMPTSEASTEDACQPHHGGELLQDARTTLNRLGLGPHVQQQPTPNEDWSSTNLMSAAPDLFTYFDDPFWNNFNFSDVDFNMQNLPGMDLV